MKGEVDGVGKYSIETELFLPGDNDDLLILRTASGCRAARAPPN